MKADLPVEINPEIMNGVPVFCGTRVPVQSLFEYLGDNLSLDEFLDCFPTVKRTDAIAVLKIPPVKLVETGVRVQIVKNFKGKK